MLIITGFYASLLALFIFILTARVVRLRFKHKVGVLDGGHHDLISAIRVHGNAIETIPIALILFACAESLHMPPIGLHTAGILLILFRSLHAYGLTQSTGQSFGRFYGVIGTWAVIVGMGLYNLFQALSYFLSAAV